MCFRLCFKVFICSVLVNLVFSYDSEMNSAIPDLYDRFLNHFGLSPLRKLYQKCIMKDNTLEECISVQTIVLLDQIIHKDVVSVSNGIKMVVKKVSSGRSLPQDILTEEKLEANLPRSTDARQEVLDRLMVDKLSSFINTHILHISLPDARGLRRQGLKLKKMLLPFLIGVIMKGASILPVILGGMKIIAIKALLASKGALILMSLLGLKKFVYGHHHGQQKQVLYHHDLGLSSAGHGYTNLLHHGGGTGYASDLQAVGHRHGEVIYKRSLNSPETSSEDGNLS